MTTLMNERGGVASLHLGLRRRIGGLLALAAADGALDAGLRRRLTQLYLHGECLKLLADRSVSGACHGRPFGPESSLAKLLWSDTEQELVDLATELLGMEALAGERGAARLLARSYSIAGGTTQVNKNIIATRILGLPRS
jgi:alkylation response protein AidB-like acyl-CoA dehydrogenase